MVYSSVRQAAVLLATMVSFSVFSSALSVSAQTAEPSTSPKPASSSTPKPTPKPTTKPAIDTRKLPAGELLQQASKAGAFKTLTQAIQAAGVGGALKARGGTYTIFAPTDEAFAALPAGVLEKLVKPENRSVLAQILAYHVVPGEYTSKKLRTGGLATLRGGLAINATPQRVIVNDARVIQADLQASNAVIHAINRVLIPIDIKKQLQSLK